MIKIRLMSEDLDEISEAIETMEKLFPEMRFTSPRIGNNPKYSNNPKYLSYGEPRIKNKVPLKVDFSRFYKKT